MDRETSALLFEIFKSFWPICLPFILANNRKHEQNQTKIEKLEQDLNGYGARLSAFGERLKQALTHETLNGELDKLYALLRLQGEAIAGMRSTMESIEKQTNCIDNWLRKQTQ